MSMWGDNDWRQRVLEETLYFMDDEDFDSITAAQGLCDVARYLLGNAAVRDKKLSKLYTEAKEDAKQELLRKVMGGYNAD